MYIVYVALPSKSWVRGCQPKAFCIYINTKYPKLPEPPNPPSVLIGEIHSEDTPRKESWTTRLRLRRTLPPLLKMAPKGEPKRRVKLSNPRGDSGKISNNIELSSGNPNEHIYTYILLKLFYFFIY